MINPHEEGVNTGLKKLALTDAPSAISTLSRDGGFFQSRAIGRQKHPVMY